MTKSRGLITPKGHSVRWLRAVVASGTEECALWPGARGSHGYGVLKWEGRLRLAHHVALILDGREPPVPPLEARHLCGNGHLGCVTPKHLVLGTRTENMADALVHGTRATKLTDAEVRAIRASTSSQRAIAAEFGVTRKTVRSIRSGVTWQHL